MKDGSLKQKFLAKRLGSLEKARIKYDDKHAKHEGDIASNRLQGIGLSKGLADKVGNVQTAGQKLINKTKRSFNKLLGR